jgi:hypothetical protein
MSSFQYLCFFETDDGSRLFTNCASPKPSIGSLVDAYPTYEDLAQGQNAKTATIAKVGFTSSLGTERQGCAADETVYSFSPLCHKQVPQSTASDSTTGATQRKQMYATRYTTILTTAMPNLMSSQLKVPANPPVWTKPPAALASPNETIPVSRFCASHLPDWEVSSDPNKGPQSSRNPVPVNTELRASSSS